MIPIRKPFFWISVFVFFGVYFISMAAEQSDEFPLELFMPAILSQGECTPDCEGKECGDDGCGGSCGTCDSGEICQGGTCVDSGGDPDALNDCQGQPVLVGTFGQTTTVNAFPGGTTYTDSINTVSGNGCQAGQNQPDSVVCFTPSNACSVSVRIHNAGEETSMNTINGCDRTPPNCWAGGISGVSDVFLTPDFMVCFVGSAAGAPSSATYVFENLDACGVLKGN